MVKIHILALEARAEAYYGNLHLALAPGNPGWRKAASLAFYVVPADKPLVAWATPVPLHLLGPQASGLSPSPTVRVHRPLPRYLRAHY